MNRLLEGTATNSSGYTLYIVLAVLLVGFVVMHFLSKRRDKKLSEEKNALIESFKKGTKVITSFGVYGEVEEIKETTDGKVVLISTGEGKQKTYMNVHINAIMNIDKKQDVIYDAEGNDITPYEEIDKQNNDVQEVETKEESVDDVENNKVADNIEDGSSKETAKKSKKSTSKQSE